jgi:hypothetical protein
MTSRFGDERPAFALADRVEFNAVGAQDGVEV